MSKKTKILILLIIIAAVFCIILSKKFLKTESNKTFIIGNNINNISNIEDNILKIQSYEADITIKVISNKTENEYKVSQKFVSPNLYKTEVLSPENIKGVTTIFDGKNLKILNTDLELSKIYSSYETLLDNHMLLSTFIKNYVETEESSFERTTNYIILKTSIANGTKYAKNKKLYIDINTLMPAKLEIEDVNQKTLVYILYNEVRFNNLTKDKIFI